MRSNQCNDDDEFVNANISTSTTFATQINTSIAPDNEDDRFMEVATFDRDQRND